MTTKQQALAIVAAKTPSWSIGSTKDAAEFSIGDTFDVILDGAGEFQKIVHTETATGTPRDLAPDNPPAACLWLNGILTLSFSYNQGESDFIIKFSVTSNPMAFEYERANGAPGGSGAGEKGGGQ